MEKLKYEKATANVVMFDSKDYIATEDCVGNNFTGYSGSSPYQWGPHGC